MANEGDLGFDFEWARSGYEVRRGDAPPLPSDALDDGEQNFVDCLAAGMSKADAYITARMAKVPASLVAPDLPELKQKYIVAVGAPTTHRPTAHAMNMAIRLLMDTRTEHLERNALTVAKALGMLQRDSQRGSSEWLPAWGLLISELKDIFGLGSVSKDFQFEEQVCSIGLHISVKAERVTLRMRPENLRSALLYHAALKAASGSVVRKCAQCANMFFAGEGGKRSDAKYCSSKCRSAFHNNEVRKS